MTGGSNSLQHGLSFTVGDEEHHMPFPQLTVHRGKLLLVKIESENQILAYCLGTLIYLSGCVAVKLPFVSLITTHLTLEECKGSVSSCCLPWASCSGFSLCDMRGRAVSWKSNIKLLMKSQLLPLLDISGSGRKETSNNDCHYGCCVP